jgi:hypothetical protein
LTLGAMALATRVRVEVAVTAMVVMWLGGVGLLASAQAGQPVAALELFTAAGQFGSAALAVVAAAVLVVRRNSFVTLEVRA